MIYLDHAAATPVHPKALQAMLPYFTEDFFNPSAPYLPAKHVREAYERAKDQLAHTIGAKGVDLVITAGATESINLAFTVAQHKVLVLATEHAAVLEAAKLHTCELIKVDPQGVIDLADFRQKLTDDVDFISISLANNELGTVQPFSEITEIIRAERQRRMQNGNNLPLYFHSDASQALNLLDLNVSRLGVDLLTINAAKCGGPKGVGALYLAHGVKITPLTVGGGQERGLRSGTENVPGVIGFAVAAEKAKSHLSGNRQKYQKMAQILRQELLKITDFYPSEDSKPSRNTESTSDCQKSPQPSIIPQNREKVNSKILFLGQSKRQLANFCPVSFPGLDAERLIYRLEQRGVLVSTGAACAANKGTKSHVLAAIGLSDEEIAGSLRLSLGSTNTIDDIREAARIIREEAEREYTRLANRQSGARP